MRNSRLAVLKNMEADDMFSVSEPVETFKDQTPIAACDDSAVLNNSTSSGAYVPENAHDTVGTVGTEAIGKI